MSRRASSKGTSSEGKWRGARERTELASLLWSLLGTGGTGLLSRASASKVGFRNGLGSWREEEDESERERLREEEREREEAGDDERGSKRDKGERESR